MTHETAAEAPSAETIDLDRGRWVALLRLLRVHGYHFITPTPATHRRVLRRPAMQVARTLRDVLGWSLPFSRDVLPAPVFTALDGLNALAPSGDLWRARIRVSSLGADLFLHSAFPPTDEDAVFFGPDTYRFAAFIERALEAADPVDTLIDIGTGSGAGAVAAAKASRARRVIVSDINPLALALAAANLTAAGVEAEVRQGCGLSSAPEPADLIIANPPFISDPEGRTYRDGGEMHGAQLSLDWARAASGQLLPGGRLLLYTGAAIVDGADALRQALSDTLDQGAFALDYREIDPDIFGGQLGARGYEAVERIAAVGAVVRRRA